MDEFAWASTVGRIRILEQTFMPRSYLLSLAEARDLAAVVGALRDSPYGPYLSRTENEDTLERALERFLRDQFQMVESMSPETAFTDIFRLRYDFHNLKVLARARFLGEVPAEEAFSHLGSIDTGVLSEILSNVEKRGLSREKSDKDSSLDVGANALQEESSHPGHYRLKLVERALTGLSRNIEEIRKSFLDQSSAGPDRSKYLWMLMDGFIDCAYYQLAGEVYRRLAYEGVLELFRSEVDLVNLKMFLRAKRQRLPAETFSQIILDSGFAPRSLLENAYASKESLARLIEVFKETPWASLASEGAQLLERGESLTKWEKQCDNALIAVARKFKTYPMGPEPAVGYLFGREVEVKNLRIILTGKESQVSSQEISERLRDSYA